MDNICNVSCQYIAKTNKLKQTTAVINFIICIRFILNITAPSFSIIICCNYDTDF